VLSKGKVIADSYLDREDVVETESPDPDLKQLESILWIANMHTVNIMCIQFKNKYYVYINQWELLICFHQDGVITNLPRAIDAIYNLIIFIETFLVYFS
jgi:hypothetical protein